MLPCVHFHKAIVLSMLRVDLTIISSSMRLNLVSGAQQISELSHIITNALVSKAFARN